MTLKLNAAPSTFAATFAKLKTRQDIAALLEIPLKQLAYHLYVRKDPYIVFSILKASGGQRQIKSPITALKIIQRKLADVLNEIYRPKKCAHGFVRDRSIVSNAKTHIGARFILNLDLKNFFPSIHFGRVRGMFMGKPYDLPQEAATVLAQICCHDKQLPQGAPTSPIISNMICGKLDSDLQKLAKRYNCLYTRYADDLTFSTRTTIFPKSLAKVEQTETGASIVVGGELEGTIASNGFQINPNKTRLHTRHRRQEVTGLTINEFPNVRRRFISQIRAMLRAWQVFGLAKAETEFHARYYRKQRNPILPLPSFTRVLKGKIDFLGMVRGKDDTLYIHFLKHYGRLNPGYSFRVTAGLRTSWDLMQEALWVLETAYDDDKGNAVISQGTAFALEGVGIVTCAHVVNGGSTEAFRASEPSKKLKVRVLQKNVDLDVALIEISGHYAVQLQAADPAQVKQLDPVTVLGSPNYNLGDQVLIHQGQVTGFRPKNGIRRILIDAHIVQGNSGGPVLDDKHRVIGLAVTGAQDQTSAPHTENQRRHSDRRPPALEPRAFPVMTHSSVRTR